MTNKEFLSQFLNEETKTGRRKRGVRVLSARLNTLLRFLEQEGLKAEEVFIREALAFRDYLSSSLNLKGRAYNPGTLNGVLSASMVFYDYLKSRGIVFTNPFKEIRKLREEKRLPENTLKEHQLNTLLEELSRFNEQENLKESITLYKLHIIAELMYGSGLRISEAANLETDDIDFDRGLIRVREGKGGLSRTAWLNDYARELLKLYLTQTRKLLLGHWQGPHKDRFFFSSESCLEKFVNRNIKRIACGLKLGRVTSHGFRHALGTHLLRAGCGIRHIQQILGHRRITSTEIYTRVEKEELKRVLDVFHPRNKWRRYKDEVSKPGNT